MLSILFKWLTAAWDQKRNQYGETQNLENRLGGFDTGDQGD